MGEIVKKAGEGIRKVSRTPIIALANPALGTAEIGARVFSGGKKGITQTVEKALDPLLSSEKPPELPSPGLEGESTRELTEAEQAAARQKSILETARRRPGRSLLTRTQAPRVGRSTLITGRSGF